MYVEQTSQWLKSRLALHKSYIKKGIDLCALAHVINFSNVEILDAENNYEKRIFLEMTNVNSFPNIINKKSDTQNLNTIYTYFYDGSLDG